MITLLAFVESGVKTLLGPVYVRMSASSPVDDHFETEEDDRDYAARMDDILGSGDEQHDSDEEGFVYDGEDAEASGPYNEQLSEVLEQNLDDLDELEDAEHVGKMLLRSAPSELKPSDDPVSISCE